MRWSGIAMTALSLVVLTASAYAGPIWVREVVDANPMHGAQGLSASAIDFEGQPAVVYRKWDGSQQPTLVIASHSSTGWITNTIATPTGHEGFLFSDAVTIHGQTFAAVAFDKSGLQGTPNSLRILQHTATGWQTIFERDGVGDNYGNLLRLGSFNGQLAAVYSGVDSGSSPRTTQFLYRDAKGKFHEESAPRLSQGGSISLAFTQVGKEIVVAQGCLSSSLELRRDASGKWTRSVLTPSASLSYPEITKFGSTSYVFDAQRPLSSGQPSLTYLLTNTGAGWVKSHPFPDYPRVGGSSWLTMDGHLYLAYEAGAQDRTGRVFWWKLANGRFTEQVLGPGLAGPDFRQLSTASIDDLAMVAMMNTNLPSGQDQIVVFREVAAVPEMETISLLGIGSAIVLLMRKWFGVRLL